jgi:hypothetical protein
VRGDSEGPLFDSLFLLEHVRFVFVLITHTRYDYPS